MMLSISSAPSERDKGRFAANGLPLVHLACGSQSPGFLQLMYLDPFPTISVTEMSGLSHCVRTITDGLDAARFCHWICSIGQLCCLWCTHTVRLMSAQLAWIHGLSLVLLISAMITHAFAASQVAFAATDMFEECRIQSNVRSWCSRALPLDLQQWPALLSLVHTHSPCYVSTVDALDPFNAICCLCSNRHG